MPQPLQPFLPTRWLVTSPDGSLDPDIFPLLPGQMFITEKAPTWSTSIAIAASGRERRQKRWSSPQWTFKVQYEVLRDGPSFQEQQILLAFFNAHAGQYTEFRYLDPSDHSVSGQSFGTGDGVTTVFQLQRTFGMGRIQFTEPVLSTTGAITVRLSDPQWAAQGLAQTDNARTNLETQSSNFAAGAWGVQNATIGGNVAVAPDGTTTADSLTPSAVSNNHLVEDGTGRGSGDFTFSIYAKANGYPRLGIRVFDGTTYVLRATFDISAGTIVLTEAGTASIQSVGNGWYRCIVSGTSASGNMGATSGWCVESLPSGSLVQATFTGNGTSGALIWGAQIETGLVATPYIPTAGATVTVPGLIVTNYSVDNYGVLTFTSPPPVGAALTWDGTFMFRCRFDQDNLPVQQLMQGLWDQGGITFRSIKS